MEEEQKESIQTIGLVTVQAPDLPLDSYDVTFVNFSNDTYEYIRRYTTLLDPINVENGIIDKLLVNSGTASTNTSTGALIVQGGVGIVQNLNIGGDSTIAGVTTITNTTNAVNKDTGALVVEGGVGIEQNLYVGGTFISGSSISVGSTTESTDKDTGSLVIEGGVGIEKNLNAGGSFTILGIGTINNSTSSISTTTGAFQVKGGVGVGENLNVGNNLYVAGVSTFVGNVNFLGGTNGTITFGDTSGDNIDFKGDVISNIIPDTNNTFDLGSPLQQWRDGYFAGTLIAGIVNIGFTSITNASIGISTVSGQLVLTGPNSTATGGGQLYLNGTTGNRIDFNTNGVAAPTFTTRSVGTKIVLYPQVSATEVDYALGINGSTLWYSVPGSTGYTHNWYGGTTSMMSLSGTNLSVTGDITAFVSDERLKENIQPIENALDKVTNLSGFTYTFNETGQSLGFDGNITYVGVSAQEVEKVLPEAVKPATSDPKYNTVQYEKIVPLLIEAIKDLKKEIDQLKKQGS